MLCARAAGASLQRGCLHVYWGLDAMEAITVKYRCWAVFLMLAIFPGRREMLQGTPVDSMYYVKVYNLGWEEEVLGY